MVEIHNLVNQSKNDPNYPNFTYQQSKNIHINDNSYQLEQIPKINGAIVAIRAMNDGCRLWVGQNITTPGGRPFHAGFTGSNG